MSASVLDEVGSLDGADDDLIAIRRGILRRVVHELEWLHSLTGAVSRGNTISDLKDRIVPRNNC